MGPAVANCLALFLTLSSGMFNASAAFLPQSFTMYALLLCFALHMQGRSTAAVGAMAVAGLIGWPFVAVMCLPVVVDLLIRLGPLRFALGSVVAAAAVLVPSVLLDYTFYHRWVVAALNIAIYNSSSTHGANLYGVEPWHYYVKNLILNFNLVVPLALLGTARALWAVLLKRSTRQSSRAWAAWRYCLGPLWLWMAAMLYMPHKEERFLFVVYPLLCLAVRVHALHCCIRSARALAVDRRRPWVWWTSSRSFAAGVQGASWG